MSSIPDSLWREGLSMDSSIFSDDEDDSIFSDDEFLDWTWPASLPRRCDREQNYAVRSSSCSCSSGSGSGSGRSSNTEELFSYCTEELGSESTSGVGDDACVALSENRQRSSSSSSSSPSNTHLYMSEEEYISMEPSACVHASTTGRCTYPHCHAVSRAFPPPIASLLTDRPLMRSFKSNGRFILKKVSNVSRSLFHSTRENGHLRLDLLSYSFECLKSQCRLRFPVSCPVSTAFEGGAAESMSGFQHARHSYMGSLPSPYHWPKSTSPYSILHQKPTLKYKTLSCPPSKLQAIAMLMRTKGAEEESVSPSSTSFQAEHLIKGQAGGNAALAQSIPKIFAVLKVLPLGLGLVIFEVEKLKGGDRVAMYGMYISKNFGFQGDVTTWSATHHHLTGISGQIGSTDLQGKLFPFGGRYMKGVFSKIASF